MAVVQPLKIAAGIITRIPTTDDITIRVLRLADGGSQDGYLELDNGVSAAVSAANEGRLRYNATSQTFQTSVNAGAYADIGGGGGDPTSQIIEANGAITTTSTSDVLATSMTVTPASGTYLVWFTSSLSNNQSDADTFASIWSAGAQVTSSERECQFNRQDDVAGFCCTARVAVNGSQAIEGRWRVGAGTGSMQPDRSLVILKVAA